MPLRILQLSDTHLTAEADGTLLGFPPHESLRRVVAAAQAEAPDLILHTGDLAQDSTPAAYTTLGPLLRPLGAPCYWIPGNHDVEAVMGAALEGAPFRPQRSFRAGGWRFLLLNSAVPGEVHGRLTNRTLNWLDDELAAHPDAPTCLALHHAPIPVGAAWLNPINLHNPDSLRARIDAHPQIKLILFGHIHQAMEAHWGDATLYSCPSTCFQFAPHAETFALDDAAPGYRMLTLHPDGTFATEVKRVAVPFTPNADATGY